jgi:hypothetical protein
MRLDAKWQATSLPWLPLASLPLHPTFFSFCMSNSTSNVILVDNSGAELINTVSYALNGISLVACIAVLVVYGYLRATRPTLVDRTSLRLSATISFSDLVFSIFQILSLAVRQESFLCSFAVWGFVCWANLVAFLYVAIALNLHLVFVLKQKRLFSEWWYYIVAVVLAGATSAAGAAGAQYGWNETQATCWYRGEGSLSSILWQWGTLYLWASVASVYCLVVVVIVSRKLVQESRVLDQTIRAYPEQSVEQLQPSSTAVRRRKRQLQILHLVRRLMLYPLIPMLTESWNIIVAMLIYTQNDAPFWLVFVSFQATSVQGLLNAIAFFLDPAILHAIDVWRTETTSEEEDEQETPSVMQLLCCTTSMPVENDQSQTRSNRRKSRLWWQVREEDLEMHNVAPPSQSTEVLERPKQPERGQTWEWIDCRVIFLEEDTVSADDQIVLNPAQASLPSSVGEDYFKVL